MSIPENATVFHADDDPAKIHAARDRGEHVVILSGRRWWLPLRDSVFAVLEVDTNASNSSCGEEFLDSIWNERTDADRRAAELDVARVARYTLNKANGPHDVDPS